MQRMWKEEEDTWCGQYAVEVIEMEKGAEESGHGSESSDSLRSEIQALKAEIDTSKQEAASFKWRLIDRPVSSAASLRGQFQMQLH